MSFRFGFAMMAAAPACSELLALDGFHSSVHLFKATAEPGEPLQWLQVGQSQANQKLESRSTCADTTQGRIYYVASENGVAKLYGMDTLDGTLAAEIELPQLPEPGSDFDASQGVWWKLGCDSATGIVYVICDYDFKWEGIDRMDKRTVWRYDGATLDSAFTFKVDPFQPIYHSGGDIAVNSEDGLLSILDAFESGSGLNMAVFDTQKGAKLVEDGTPCAQVYDSVKKRFFGMCTAVLPGSGLYVPFSCWWTGTEQPHLMEQLLDYSECATNINTLDTENRVAFFNIGDRIASLSLDTGKKLSEVPTRSVASAYQHMPSAFVQKQPADSISV